jgi:hypothetical protein
MKSNKLKSEKEALTALTENPFSLGKADKKLWKSPLLLRQAFGKFEEGSPDEGYALEKFVDKLKDNWHIDKMKASHERSDLGQGFFKITCYEVIEYKDAENNKCKGMFFCIDFQAQPILLYLGQVAEDDGDGGVHWSTNISYFKDEDKNAELSQNGRLDELMGDLDLVGGDDEDEN